MAFRFEAFNIWHKAVASNEIGLITKNFPVEERHRCSVQQKRKAKPPGACLRNYRKNMND